MNFVEKISIVVPCYNQAKYLSDALDSVLIQTYQNWECIIVNDGSLDNTEEIVNKYRNIDGRFKYIYQENRGVSSARNNAISIAIGDYILPLDGDDKIDRTYIEKAILYFRQNPKTKLVYCKAYFFGELNKEWNLPKYDYEKLIWNNCIFCSAIFRRSDFCNTSGYNENMKLGYEDWDFWLTFLNREDIVHRIEEPLFFYRIKSKSRNVFAATNCIDLYKQIYRNHIDIYQPYAEQIIFLQDSKTIDLLNQINLLDLQIKQIYNSRAYRLGNFLLGKWNNLFKKKC